MTCRDEWMGEEEEEKKLRNYGLSAGYNYVDHVTWLFSVCRLFVNVILFAATGL